MATQSAPKDGPIKFSCFKSGVLENVPLKFKFRFDDIDHPLYGKATNLEAELPLLYTRESLDVSKYYDLSKEDQDDILTRFVKRIQHLHDDLDDDEMRQKCLGWIFCSTAIYPLVDPKSEVYDASLDILGACFKVDDFMDEEEGFGELDFKTSLIFKRYEVWEKLFDGEYELIPELFKALPHMEAPFTVVLEAVKKFDQNVPNIRTNFGYFMRPTFFAGQGVPLAYKTGALDNLSEEVMKVLRGLDAGGEGAIENSALIQNISVPKYIRESLLFRLLLSSLITSFGLINDLIGFQKDVKNSYTNGNVILRRVVREGIPLEVSFREAVDRQYDTANDIQILSDKLMEAFPLKEVEDYVRICKHFYDGNLYFYFLMSQHQLRYGSTEMEIVHAV